MKWLLIFLLLSACTEAEDDAGWGGSVENLPNGATRVANPAQGLWESGGAWSLVPELVIGLAEGPEAEMFASISGLEVDDEGRIYVLDRQIKELRIFTADGAFERSVGRSGGGPGEYTAPNGLLWVGSDTLAVVDQQAGRYTLLTPEGEYLYSSPRQLGFYGWSFRGGYHAGRIYETSSVGRDADRQPALLGTVLGRSAAPALSGAAAQVEDSRHTGIPDVDSILLPTSHAPLPEPFSIRTAQGGMVMSVPFAPLPVYYLNPEGTVWHGHSSEFRLVKSSLAGDTIMEIELDATAAPVSEEELEKWASGPGVAQFRERGGRLDMSRIPTVKPLFEGIYSDEERNLWVSVPAGPMEVLFALFDPDGRFLGRVQVSGMRRDVYVPPVVRNGRLHFVGRDEMDVQRVYVFGIQK